MTGKLTVKTSVAVSIREIWHDASDLKTLHKSRAAEQMEARRRAGSLVIKPESSFLSQFLYAKRLAPRHCFACEHTTYYLSVTHLYAASSQTLFTDLKRRGSPFWP